MSRFLPLLLVLLTACIGPKTAPMSSSSVSSPVFADNIVVAHRGAWKAGGLPENSIASLREAIRLGCTGTEFDVRLTSDDSLLVVHDEVHGGMEVARHTYAELTAIPLANGEKLPTLREYLAAGLRDNPGTRLVCELKPSEVSTERDVRTATLAVALVAELKAEAWVPYISFSYPILLRILELNPAADTQYLNGEKTPDELKKDRINGLDYNYRVYQEHPEWVAAAKRNRQALNAWTVNDAADMDRLIQQGFDFITTNEPELLLKKVR